MGAIDNDCDLHGLKLFGRIPVYPVEAARGLAWDRIVVCNNSGDIVRAEIHEQLTGMGVPEGMINFYPEEHMPEWIDQRRGFFRDFSCYASLNTIDGAVAECGVFSGETAKFLNLYFRERRLYLFDSFEGFSEEDINSERAFEDEAFLAGPLNKVGMLRQPSVKVVMDKIMFPDNVVIKKGWVPDSFEGVDDVFCFVNLDMDLYAPMLAALLFFWPRMSQGGIILLHDYFHPELPGVKRAVDAFEAECGAVCKFPIGDGCSLGIVKP
ncbi:MAG: TylF/MycF family methyltransferase [Clostridiales Family XIII bacterium]|nr:TylF/MycF family methyltransferase [Clostridiales Family XIII bacterium]